MIDGLIAAAGTIITQLKQKNNMNHISVTIK